MDARRRFGAYRFRQASVELNIPERRVRSGSIVADGVLIAARFQRCRGASSQVLQFFCISAILLSMKTTLTMTERGVITLPAKLRKAMGLSADDQLIAETTPEGLLLRPAVTLPIELYSDERLREFDAAEAELAAVLNKKSH